MLLHDLLSEITRITTLFTEFVLCIVSLITVLPDAWCGIIPGYFRSRTICNGEIQGSSDCGDYRVNILRLKETIVERLSRALADTCGIIHTYVCI